jgi:hypothetical protein
MPRYIRVRDEAGHMYAIDEDVSILSAAPFGTESVEEVEGQSRLSLDGEPVNDLGDGRYQTLYSGLLLTRIDN